MASSPREGTVLVVEDETSISEPLISALRRAGFEPVLADTAAEAMELFATSAPDLVLLDLMLPDGDGRDVARAIRLEHETPIIMLTARGDEADRVIGLEIGADDYVVKPFSSTELIARIRAVLRRAGDQGAAGGTVVLGPLKVDLEARRATLEGRDVSLTRKEFDLLALLASNAGRVVERDVIMARVWDENWFGSTKTLDVHMSALRRKLDDEIDSPRFIHTVRGVGFRLASPGEEEQ
jgi:two-component system, OmpR family, response regulator RegX3